MALRNIAVEIFESNGLRTVVARGRDDAYALGDPRGEVRVEIKDAGVLKECGGICQKAVAALEVAQKAAASDLPSLQKEVEYLRGRDAILRSYEEKAAKP